MVFLKKKSPRKNVLLTESCRIKRQEGNCLGIHPDLKKYIHLGLAQVQQNETKQHHNKPKIQTQEIGLLAKKSCEFLWPQVFTESLAGRTCGTQVPFPHKTGEAQQHIVSMVRNCSQGLWFPEWVRLLELVHSQSGCLPQHPLPKALYEEDRSLILH